MKRCDFCEAKDESVQKIRGFLVMRDDPRNAARLDTPVLCEACYERLLARLQQVLNGLS